MKSKFIVTIIIVLLSVTLIPNFIYAVDLKNLEVNRGTFADFDGTYTEDAWNKLKDEAKADVNTENGKKKMQLDETISLGAGVGTILGTIALLPMVIISTGLTAITRGADDLLIKGDTVTAWDESKKAELGKVGGYSINFFTIEDTVFGKIELFDADYFLTDKNDDQINQAIKDSVAIFYYILRIIALILGLLTLIYVGIRMALSTVASETAKYKNMLKNWLVSMILIFAMPYIIGIINLVANTITNLFATANANKGFEKSILWQTLNLFNITSGWSYIATALMYIVITFYQIKFFLMYFNRLLSMGFLIVISPLITILYTLDTTKISGQGGKSPVFSSWFREYAINAFLQPLHAGIYLFFIASANEIFKVAPLLAVLFFGMLSKAESIVKNIIGMSNTQSIRGMKEYLPVNRVKDFLR